MRVSQISTIGEPRCWRSSSKAATRAAMSLPSTRSACQPNARHLSVTGSVRSTSSVGPSACRALTSTIAVTLSNPWCAQTIAASHVEPSSSSPSESRLNTRAGLPRCRSPSAIPLATASPCPSEPPRSPAGRVGGHRRHGQPRVVRPVRLQFLHRDDAGLGQRGVQRDRVVANREQEPVPLGQCGSSRRNRSWSRNHGQDVGDTQRLPDVPLPRTSPMSSA